jgi:DNA topoisomerase-2
LGSSTSEDVKRYFGDMPGHTRTFLPVTPAGCSLLNLVFNKKLADDRKTWLNGLEPGTYLDHSTTEISIEDFVNKELILFCKFTLSTDSDPLFGIYHSLPPSLTLSLSLSLSIDLAMADNVRNIPSIVDGLKPVQRMILYTCFLLKMMEAVKVGPEFMYSLVV